MSLETEPKSFLFPSLTWQEPEKRIVQELLETEQAYVARLHLLDQASGYNPTQSQHPIVSPLLLCCPSASPEPLLGLTPGASSH